MRPELPIPSFYDAQKAESVWRVDYLGRAADAEAYAKQHQVPIASTDQPRVVVMGIDMQNTFCLPEFELYVGGQSGRGAIEDNQRFAQFVYRNLQNITQIALTMDTHWAEQIFHPVFWVNDKGENPPPSTMITVDDVKNRVWMVNPAIAGYVTGGNLPYLERHALHYVESLAAGGKYALMVWPYHAMLGGIGHALVSTVHEAAFFHTIARKSGTDFQVKGGNLLTENYSIVAPEVTEQYNGDPLGQVNVAFFEKLMSFDYVVIAGQAKSHCVAWTIDDILTRILAKDHNLAKKVYLLEDCTSPVVIPGVLDFTDQANEAFDKFAKAGMHVVQSTVPMEKWPGVK